MINGETNDSQLSQYLPGEHHRTIRNLRWFTSDFMCSVSFFNVSLLEFSQRVIFLRNDLGTFLGNTRRTNQILRWWNGKTLSRWRSIFRQCIWWTLTRSRRHSRWRWDHRSRQKKDEGVVSFLERMSEEQRNWLNRVWRRKLNRWSKNIIDRSTFNRLLRSFLQPFQLRENRSQFIVWFSLGNWSKIATVCGREEEVSFICPKWISLLWSSLDLILLSKWLKQLETKHLVLLKEHRWSEVIQHHIIKCLQQIRKEFPHELKHFLKNVVADANQISKSSFAQVSGIEQDVSKGQNDNHFSLMLLDLISTNVSTC